MGWEEGRGHTAAWERGVRTARCPPAAPPRLQSPVLFEADLCSAFVGKIPTSGCPDPSTFTAVLLIWEQSSALCHPGPSCVGTTWAQGSGAPRCGDTDAPNAAEALGFSTLQGSRGGHRVQGRRAGSSAVPEPNGQRWGHTGKGGAEDPEPSWPRAWLSRPHLPAAAGGRAAGRRAAGVCQQAGHAQRHGRERADRQAGPAGAAQQDRECAGTSGGTSGTTSGTPRGVQPGAHSPPGRLPPPLLPLFCSGTCRRRVPPRAQGSTTGWTGSRTSSPSARRSVGRRQAGDISQLLFSLGSLLFFFLGGVFPLPPAWPRLCVFIW